MLSRSFLITIIATIGFTEPSLAQSTWVPKTCGQEPVMPKLDLSTIVGYNDAIKKASAYSKGAKTYNDCVVKEGNAVQLAISKDAQIKIDAIHDAGVAINKRIVANFNMITAQLKEARLKLSK